MRGRREPQGVRDVLDRSFRLAQQRDRRQDPALRRQCAEAPGTGPCRPRRQRPATDTDAARKRARAQWINHVLEAEEHERELARRHHLLRGKNDGLDCMRERPAFQQTPETQDVVIDIAHNDASRAGAGERDQFTQALGTAIGVNVDRSPLPAGADRGDACRKRLAELVVRWNHDERDARLATL